MRLKALKEFISSENIELDKIFNNTLREIFSKNYLVKIKNVIKRKIKIIPVKAKGRNFYAFYVGGGKIQVNNDLFFSDKLNDKERVSILAHEFIHVLQKRIFYKKFFFVKNFKQIHILGKQLREIVKKYTENPTLFLTGKKHITLGPGNLLHEIIPYLIMGTVKWNHINPMGKQAFLTALKNSQIFNLKSNFWQERL